ncbi:MAG: hypothetical protein GX425_01295 [Peptococcaceae bacterium]|nr:hypothetical protein [Peptococcaceae bacterium]
MDDAGKLGLHALMVDRVEDTRFHLGHLRAEFVNGLLDLRELLADVRPL